MASFYLDVNLDEIYEELSSLDKKELAEWLKEDGYLDEENALSLYENEFEEIINKIKQNRLLLTNEEDEILRKISNRF